MFPLQITNRKWRKWKFVDGFHRLPDSSSLFHVHGSTLSDRYYCEFLWSWEKFLWRWSTVQPKMRYATVVVKVHAGKTAKWAHALMIGKESLKGWWILTTLKKWTGWAQALFRKVVGDRFYSSSVPKYIYFVFSVQVYFDFSDIRLPVTIIKSHLPDEILGNMNNINLHPVF